MLPSPIGDHSHAPHNCRVIRVPHACNTIRSGYAGDAYRVQGSDPYGNSCFQGVLRDAFPDRVPKGYITGPITWLGRSDVAFAANRVTFSGTR